VTPLEIVKELNACAEGIKDRVARASAAVVGHEGTLKVGKYAGRTGQITGVWADEGDGIMLLFMVYKIGTTEFLNSDGDSRCCWHIEEIMIHG